MKKNALKTKTTSNSAKTIMYKSIKNNMKINKL